MWRIWNLVLVCALAVPLPADEGMWLYGAFPKDAVKAKYGFDVTGQFLENLRLATVGIGGGSGSFVSPNGLILTNHHLASECIGSSADEGFAAESQARERACPNLEARVLVAAEDVTKPVKAAAGASAKTAEGLEKSCEQKTGNACSVVKLYAGERYELYQYRRYGDVRLVFAPEFGVAFFGGEADRFTYPRYGLDIAFLRAYENGKPAATPHYLKWSPSGVMENELVFTAGSPGATSRLATQAQLAFFRGVQLPFALSRLMSRIEALRAYAARSAENQRAARSTLMSLSAEYKASAGRLLGLNDDRLAARKQQFEKRLRRAVENDPKLGTEAAKVWDDVAAAYRAWGPSEKAYQVLEQPATVGSLLFGWARLLVRLEEERGRTRELEAPAAVDQGTEVALVAQYFEELKVLGDKEAPLKAILQGRTPLQAAEAAVKGSRLGDAAERRRLAADKEALAKSADPMIQLARTIEGSARKLRKHYEETVGLVQASALDRIAQYRFKVLGPNEYPDATSSPRVAFGAVKAYRDKTEAPAPFATTFGGLYHRAGQEAPYVLPERWVAAKNELDLVAPFDFVSTCDTGGATGGAAVNTRGELVGMVFDGNIESLPLTYLYSDEQARAVYVATQGMVEALRKVYRAEGLLRELGVAAGTM